MEKVAAFLELVARSGLMGKAFEMADGARTLGLHKEAQILDIVGSLVEELHSEDAEKKSVVDFILDVTAESLGSVPEQFRR